MRRSWIALAMAAVIVVIVVAYRGGPSRKAPGSLPASGNPETPIEAPTSTSVPAAEAAIPRPPATRSAPEAAGERDHEAQAIATAETVGLGGPVLDVRSPGAPVRSADVPVQVPAPGSSSAPPTVPRELPRAVTQSENGTPAPAPAADAESDSRAPALQYLRFDPPEIKDGGVATLSIQAADDLSGVKSVSGSLRSPGETAIVPFVAQDRFGGGIYSATIAIPRQAETGDWFVGILQIVDKAENTLNLSFVRTTVPQGGTLRVVSDESDATAPVVRGVTIEKATVGAGEGNRIVVEVDDDRSGVATVTGSFQSPSKSGYIPFACGSRGDTSSWQAEIVVPADADCGAWTLRQLRVADKANNAAFLGDDAPQLSRASFVVSGGGCDSDPPTIDAFYFTPAAVSNAVATEITLTVRAHDDRSGVSTLTGRVEGPASATGQVPSIYFECAADPQDPEAPMTARIPVPQYAAKGVWRVALVQLTDKARNSRSYTRDDPALAEGHFTVE